MTLKIKVNDLYFQYQLRVSQDACLVRIWWFQLKSVTLSCDKQKFTDGRTDAGNDNTPSAWKASGVKMNQTWQTICCVPHMPWSHQLLWSIHNEKECFVLFIHRICAAARPDSIWICPNRPEPDNSLDQTYVTCMHINTLRPRQMDAISQTTFSNAFSWMKMFEFWLKFPWSLFPRVPINNIPALVQMMAWRRPGDKPLSELMMVSLLTHICITRPRWVNKHCFEFIEKIPSWLW